MIAIALNGCAVPRDDPPGVALLNAEVPGVCTMAQAAANLEAGGEVPHGVAQSAGGHAVLFTNPATSS